MINEEKALEFFQYIYARQRLYKVKQHGLVNWPWSHDEILNTYKFCNVYRQLDRTTIYLRNKIEESNLPLEDKLFWIILFRRFNTTEIFDQLGYADGLTSKFNMIEAIKRLDAAKARGVKLFSPAYTICQIPFSKTKRPRDKHAQILMSMNHLRQISHFSFLNPRIPKAKTFFHKLRLRNHRIGPFLAYQIMQDFSYVSGVKIPEFETFTYVGPGAKPALEAIYPGVHAKTRLSYENLCRQIHLAQTYFWFEMENQKLGDWKKMSAMSPEGSFLSLHNIQHNLCEWRKYFKLKADQRTCRKRYYRRTL